MTTIPKYIALTTPDELSKSDMKHWYAFVRSSCSNLVMAAQVKDDQGFPRNAVLVHAERNGRHCYKIPLTRDLAQKEVEKITKDFDLGRDFEITASAKVEKLFTDDVVVEQTAFEQLAEQWAKAEHEEWVRDRTKAGWRFGESISTKDKTHPLLRPWADLPQKHQNVDVNKPKLFFDFLKTQGYSVVSSQDLNHFNKVLRDNDIGIDALGVVGDDEKE
jgi:hypothetical protein